MTENEIMIEKIRGMTDQHELAGIAIRATDMDVRGAAVCYLTDQDVLAEIAKGNDLDFIRGTAVRRIDDQEILEELSMFDGSIHVRRVAAGMVINPIVLAEITWGDADPTVRLAAATKLTEVALRNVLATADEFGVNSIRHRLNELLDNRGSKNKKGGERWIQE